MSPGRALRRNRSLPATEYWAKASVRISIILISFLLNGDFHPDLVPGGDGSGVQQYLGLALWLIIFVATAYLPPILKIDWSAGLYANLAPYAFAIASSFWSFNPSSSFPKSATMLIVLIAAWRVTVTVSWAEIILWTQHGLVAVCVLSAMVAIFLPGIGVMNDYLHAGQWCGLFSSKQTLGFCGAILVYIAATRLMNGAPALYGWSSIFMGAITLLASGSRGAGGLAVASLLAVYAMRSSRTMVIVLAYAPFLMGIAGALLIAYLVQTGNRFIVVFGANLDFTERTFIWQHAIRFFSEAPWFGFGLNGFWTRSDITELYLERYGWLLENFHNGYIAIAVETGVVGFFLFLLGYWFFAARIRIIAQNRYLNEPDVAFCVSFVCMMFFIDFTETFFLRSTNFRATMLTMITALAFSRPFAVTVARSNSRRRDKETQAPPPQRSRRPGSPPALEAR